MARYIHDIVANINSRYAANNCPTRLSQIILWMDNCAGQFKSKFFFGYIMKYAQEHSLDFLVNYFAEQHGKVCTYSCVHMFCFRFGYLVLLSNFLAAVEYL